jgi:hypothetical protein
VCVIKIIYLFLILILFIRTSKYILEYCTKIQDIHWYSTCHLALFCCSSLANCFLLALLEMLCSLTCLWTLTFVITATYGQVQTVSISSNWQFFKLSGDDHTSERRWCKEVRRIQGRWSTHITILWFCV